MPFIKFEPYNIDEQLLKEFRNRNFSKVEQLLNKGADVNKVDEYGFSALFLAAYFDRVDIVEKLINKGADVNKSITDGWTALTWAAINGHTRVVDKLIDGGANIKKAYNFGLTALHLATIHNHHETIEVLFKKGADITALNDEFFEKYKWKIDDKGNLKKDNNGENIRWITVATKDLITSLRNPQEIAKRDEELAKLNKIKKQSLEKIDNDDKLLKSTLPESETTNISDEKPQEQIRLLKRNRDQDLDFASSSKFDISFIINNDITINSESNIRSKIMRIGNNLHDQQIDTKRQIQTDKQNFDNISDQTSSKIEKQPQSKITALEHKNLSRFNQRDDDQRLI